MQIFETNEIQHSPDPRVHQGRVDARAERLPRKHPKIFAENRRAGDETHGGKAQRRSEFLRTENEKATGSLKEKNPLMFSSVSQLSRKLAFYKTFVMHPKFPQNVKLIGDSV